MSCITEGFFFLGKKKMGRGFIGPTFENYGMPNKGSSLKLHYIPLGIVCFMYN